MAFENRPKDFFAKQIRSSHLIASGGIIDPESSDWDEQLPHLRLMIYPRDTLEVSTSTGATEYIDGAFEGIIPPTLLNDVKYNDDGQVVGGSGLKVGQDVWLFISGAQGTTHMDHDGDGELDLSEMERRSDHGVVLFGGDVVVSGTLFAERQVIEVDLSHEGQLFVSGNLRAQDYNRDINFVQFRSPGYREDVQYPDLWLSGEAAMLTHLGSHANPKMWITDAGVMTAEEAGHTGFFEAPAYVDHTIGASTLRFTAGTDHVGVAGDSLIVAIATASNGTTESFADNGDGTYTLTITIEEDVTTIADIVAVGPEASEVAISLMVDGDDTEEHAIVTTADLNGFSAPLANGDQFGTARLNGSATVADPDGDGAPISGYITCTEAEWALYAKGGPHVNKTLDTTALIDADGTPINLTALGAGGNSAFDGTTGIALDDLRDDDGALIVPIVYYTITQLNAAIAQAAGAIFANRNDAIEAGSGFLAFNPGDTLANSSVIFNVDSVHEQVGINTAIPSASLDVRRRQVKNDNNRSTINSAGTWTNEGNEQVTFLLHADDAIGYGTTTSNPLSDADHQHDDVSFYVWGKPGAKENYGDGSWADTSQKKSVTGFGGDVVVSGTLYTENGMLEIGSFHDQIGHVETMNGTVIGILQFAGTETVGNGSGPAARIEVEAAGDWEGSTPSIPARLNFYTNTGDSHTDSGTDGEGGSATVSWNSDASADGQAGLAMTIAHDQKIGIGTEDPADGLLHVYRNKIIGDIGDGSRDIANAGVHIQDSSADMYVDAHSLTVDGGDGYINIKSNNSLIFGTNDVERARIHNSGRVGIFTNDPYGLVDIRPDGYSPSADAYDDPNDFENYHLTLRSKTGDEDEGIGIAFGNSQTERSLPGAGIIYKLTEEGDGTQAGKGQLQFWTARDVTGNSMSEAMVISHTGDVGIGVDEDDWAPAAQLEIVQADTDNSDEYDEPALRLTFKEEEHYSDFQVDGTGDLRVTTSGNIIRASSDGETLLQVEGTGGSDDVKLGFDRDGDGTPDWTMGVDYSDADKFKIHWGANLGVEKIALSGDILVLETGGAASGGSADARTHILGISPDTDEISFPNQAVFWAYDKSSGDYVTRPVTDDSGTHTISGNSVKNPLRLIGLKEDNTDYHPSVDPAVGCLKPKVLVASPAGDIMYTESVLGALGQDRDSRYYNLDESGDAEWPGGALMGDDPVSTVGTPYDNGYIVPEYTDTDGNAGTPDVLTHGWDGDTPVGHAIDDLNHGLRELDESNPWEWDDTDGIVGGDVVHLKDLTNRVGLGTGDPDSKVHMAVLGGDDIDIKIEATQFDTQDPGASPGHGGTDVNDVPISRLDFSFDSKYWTAQNILDTAIAAGSYDGDPLTPPTTNHVSHRVAANASAAAATPGLSIAAMTRLGHTASGTVDVIMQSGRAGGDVSIATQHYGNMIAADGTDRGLNDEILDSNGAGTGVYIPGTADLGSLSPFKIRGDDNRERLQVLILSGTTTLTDPAALDPKYFADVNFFVSGSTGSAATAAAPMGSGIRGAACFGGDVVISGTLYTTNVINTSTISAPHVVHFEQQAQTIVYNATGNVAPMSSITLGANIHPLALGLGDDPERGPSPGEEVAWDATVAGSWAGPAASLGAIAYKNRLSVFINGQRILPNEYLLDGTDGRGIKLTMSLSIGDKLVVDRSGDPNDWGAVAGLNLGDILDVRTDQMARWQGIFGTTTDDTIDFTYVGAIGVIGNNVPIKITHDVVINNGTVDYDGVEVTWDPRGVGYAGLEITYMPNTAPPYGPTLSDIVNAVRAVAWTTDNRDIYVEAQNSAEYCAVGDCDGDPFNGTNTVCGDPDQPSFGANNNIYAFTGGIDTTAEGGSIRWSNEANTWFVSDDADDGGGGGGGAAIMIQDDGSPIDNSPAYINFVGAGIEASVIGGGVHVTVPGVASINDLPDVHAPIPTSGNILKYSAGVQAVFVMADGSTTAAITFTAVAPGSALNSTMITSIEDGSMAAGSVLVSGPTASVITISAKWSTVTGTIVTTAWGAHAVNTTITADCGSVCGIAFTAAPTGGTFDSYVSGIDAGWYPQADETGTDTTVTIQEEGTNIVSAVETMNFVGPAVTVTDDGGTAIVTIDSGLDDLSDVYASSPVAGDILKFATTVVAVTPQYTANEDPTGAIFTINAYAPGSAYNDVKFLAVNGAPGSTTTTVWNSTPGARQITITADWTSMTGDDLVTDPGYVAGAGSIVSISGGNSTVFDGLPFLGLQPWDVLGVDGVLEGWYPIVDITTLGGLSDVDNSIAPTNGNMLKYDETSGNWLPAREIYALDTHTVVNADYVTPVPGTVGGGVAAIAGKISMITGGPEQPKSIALEITKKWVSAGSASFTYGSMPSMYTTPALNVSGDTIIMGYAAARGTGPWVPGEDASVILNGIDNSSGVQIEPSVVWDAGSETLTVNYVYNATDPGITVSTIYSILLAFEDPSLDGIWYAGPGGASAATTTIDASGGPHATSGASSGEQFTISTNSNVIDSFGVRIEFMSVNPASAVTVSYERAERDLAGVMRLLDIYTIHMTTTGVGVTAADLETAINNFQSTENVNMLDILSPVTPTVEINHRHLPNYDASLHTPPDPGGHETGEIFAYIMFDGSSGAGWSTTTGSWNGLSTVGGYVPTEPTELTTVESVGSMIQTQTGEFENMMKFLHSPVRATPITDSLADVLVTDMYDISMKWWPQIIPIRSDNTGPITIVLPAANDATLYGAQQFIFKDELGNASVVHDAANTIKIAPAPGDSIDNFDNASPIELTADYDSIMIYTDGADWHLIESIPRSH